MNRKTYRVVQWATGVVGQTALKHFIENPVFELVGVLVYNPDKVGRDAGELVGLPPTGVIATDNVEQILALEADCVMFAPIGLDWDMVCRLLRSGKNVVLPLGPFYPSERTAICSPRSRPHAGRAGSLSSAAAFTRVSPAISCR